MNLLVGLTVNKIDELIKTGEKIQAMNGLNWEFRFPEYPGKVYRRLLKCPLSHVVSDAKENDTICGRLSNRSNTTCLACNCDIKIEDSDNPNINSCGTSVSTCLARKHTSICNSSSSSKMI